MSPKILIADDSSTIRRVVEHTFADIGARIIAAADGQEALDAARREHPDLVLCDVVMPGPSGYEIVEALRRDPGLRDVPVLLLTGAFEPFDEHRAAACGAAGFLAKPFESRVLRERALELLAERAGAAPPRDQDETWTGQRLPEPAPVPDARGAGNPPPADDDEPLGPLTIAAPAPEEAELPPFRVPLPGDEDFVLSFRRSRRAAGDLPEEIPGAVRDEIRRQILELAPEIIREVAWDVLPDLLERLLRESVPRPERPARPPESGEHSR